MFSNNKKTPKIFLIVKIVGIALLLFGIMRIIVANNMHVPNMGEPDWFEKSTEQSGILFSGIACCSFGVFITIAGFIPNISKATTSMALNMRANMTEDLQELKEIIDEAIGTTDTTEVKAEPKKAYCEYCGCELKKDSSKCPHCGHGK